MKRLLLVEDDPAIAKNLALLLLAEGFDLIHAATREEAVAVLDQHAFDLALIDISLPDGNGFSVCTQIRETQPIPVIFLTASGDEASVVTGLNMGADDYIPKPFSLAILTTKIQNMMRTRRRMLDKYAKSLEVEPEKITFNAMDEALLKRAMAIVEKNMDNIEFSTDEFAREMNMSRSNLHLKLKAITGESTIDFIRKIRFNEAAKLLKDGRYTVAEVSTMVGFNTPSYFATSFKKYFGCLPTEYIKKSKG